MIGSYADLSATQMHLTLSCSKSGTKINLIIKQIAFLLTNTFLCRLKDFVSPPDYCQKRLVSSPGTLFFASC